MKNIFVKNMPLAEAKEKWQQALAKINFYNGAEVATVEVENALGHSPIYNAAAMDGIAVHFADLAAASEASPVRLNKDQFTPVNTGNNLPQEFDAVVMIEDVHFVSEHEVELSNPATPWQHVRTIGEDIVTTELILPQGHKVHSRWYRLSPRDQS